MDELKTAPACSKVGKSSCASCPSAGNCTSSIGSEKEAASGTADAKSAMRLRQDEQIRNTLNKIRHKIFVMSGKGGVGKSSVAVNLAVSLARAGFKVGILDVDFHGPSVPGMLGLKGQKTGANAEKYILPLVSSDGVLVVSLDIFLDDVNHAVMWRGPQKSAAIRQFLYNVSWGELDFLVIDSPPGTGDEHMGILKVIPEALSLVVTTPQEIALADVRKALSFLQHSHARVLGLVENMSSFPCPHCGGEIALFRQKQGDKVKAMALEYSLPVLGNIPFDPYAAMASDKGISIASADNNVEIVSLAQKAFAELSLNVQKACDKGIFVTMTQS